MHPVFVAAYVFTSISVALEFASPSSSYSDIGRFTLMIAGALVVASLCRDRAALQMLMYSYILAALWLGAVLMLTSYGTLNAVVATDYGDANEARETAFKDSPIIGNLNGMAFTCVQGGIVALAFGLGSASLRLRSLFTIIGIFCLVASALPMSRGAIVSALVSCAVLIKAYGIKHGRVWLLGAVVAVSAFLLVPNAIWSRMALGTEEGAKESRVALYEDALQRIDDYLFTGVGAGNYYGNWGIQNGFARNVGGTYEVYGVHNTFLQLLINWGIIGLLAYLVIMWLAYRCLPRRNGTVLEMGMLGIVVTLLLVMPFGHDFAFKPFSLGLGMLVAYQCWLAPLEGAQPYTDR
jgi:hypothetical protein